MSVYPLIVNASAVQTVANVSNADGSNSGPNPFAMPVGSNNPNQPPPSQAFQLTVSTATPGASVSGAAQLVGSNDGKTWVTVGNPITASSAANKTSAGGAGSVPFTYFGAYVTALSGTGALANLTMSA